MSSINAFVHAGETVRSVCCTVVSEFQIERCVLTHTGLHTSFNKLLVRCPLTKEQ